MYKYKSLQVGQLPCGHLAFFQNLLNFPITKYLKQEADGKISISLDEHSLCDLSITGDIKIYQCHVIKGSWSYYPQRRSALSTSIMELLLLPKTVAPLTRDKEICHMIIWANDSTTSWGRHPNAILSMRFTYCPNLMFLASLWLEIYRFSNWSFC